MTKSKHPKVFLSHASEDKDIFVLNFAKRLYSKGIVAWVDKWEMNPGDSLIDKIFEEGINSADAIIIILSKHSVDKPWIKEELNAGMIQKINKKKKLIPILIDDCKVPECLQSIVWEQIKDINNYDTEFDRIIASVYDHYKKPALGEHPKYTQTIVTLVSGLTKVDSLILNLACKKAIASDKFNIETSEILKEAKLLDIGSEIILESLEILNGKNYIECRKVLGGGGLGSIPRFKITTFGFEEYALACIKNYDYIVRSIGIEIVNNNRMDSFSLQEASEYPDLLIEHILDVFESKNFIKVSKSLAGKVILPPIWTSEVLTVYNAADGGGRPCREGSGIPRPRCRLSFRGLREGLSRRYAASIR